MTNPPTPTMDLAGLLREVEGRIEAAFKWGFCKGAKSFLQDPEGHSEWIDYRDAIRPFITELNAARSGGEDVVELREALKALLSHDEQDAGCIPTDAHLDAQNAARAVLSRIEAGGGALPAQGPSVPTEQADRAVLVPRDQLETLRRSLELNNLLPGEGEALINCWIMASEAESKA